ncbi:uncharacterized protein Tco025E_00780 [Trypanosoma conorhini]|uniref:C2 domain-containing protein n=1 Tax=Trypanosoma conorhini TaxID=83891 RepID=A0A3R7LET1_9TRYP|nr:uncharacterized protein Tco025E_00780 [Trypanosoma conorhini]RNF26975.1 hypothetical protein Tco025E_00780 [Trypanosoma conorhini]
MSIFGAPLPHEDDTATSLIRREGYPPIGSYEQMPEVYVCPCCSSINPRHEPDNLVRTAKEEKELERRRLMQLDIFEERAKPISTAVPRPRSIPIRQEPEDEQLDQPLVPPPPMTLDELRKLQREVNKTRLIVTVHHGKNLDVHPLDPTSILVRCGALEGQTAKVPRGNGILSTWEEIFEFPYPNEEEPLELLVVDDALPAEQDHVFGGVVVPPYALRNRARGDEEVLPVCPPDEMQRGYGRMKETPLGSIVVSWYVKSSGEEAEPANVSQNLENPVDCVFVVHRIFQYTDNGAEPFTGGVLCVLRDADDNLSASTQYQPSGVATMSTSPHYTKEGFNYLPEPASQMMQLITEKRLGHVMVCVPKSDEEGGEDEGLLVVGAVSLDFGELYHRGSAVLLVESRVKEDALWGEIALEWRLTPHATLQKELEELQLLQEKVPEQAVLKQDAEEAKESLFVTVVRGVNITDQNGNPLVEAQVSLSAGQMEGSTFVALNTLEEDGATSILNWNQEMQFLGVDGGRSDMKVHILEDNEIISSGDFVLEKDSGYAVVQMHDPYDADKMMGEVLLNYRRVFATDGATPKRSEENVANNVKSDGEERALLSEGRDRPLAGQNHGYSNIDDRQENDNEEYGNRALSQEYPGEEQHALREPSAGKEQAQEYPGEEQHALREPSAGKNLSENTPGRTRSTH